MVSCFSRAEDKWLEHTCGHGCNSGSAWRQGPVHWSTISDAFSAIVIGYWLEPTCLHSFQRVAESTSVSSTAACKYYNKRTLTSQSSLVSRSTMSMEIAIRNAYSPP